MSAGIVDKLACRILRVGAADQDAAVDRREQARARRVFVRVVGASRRRVMDEDVLGERIRFSLKTWLELLSATEKRSSQRRAKDSDLQQREGQETNARQDAASSMPRRHSRQCSQYDSVKLTFSRLRLGMYVSSRLDARDGDRGSSTWVASLTATTKHWDEAGHA